MTAPQRPAGREVASGTTWWRSVPGNEAGWRPASWAVIDSPLLGFVFWLAADDGESGATTVLGRHCPEDTALAYAEMVVDDNNQARQRETGS